MLILGFVLILCFVSLLDLKERTGELGSSPNSLEFFIFSILITK